MAATYPHINIGVRNNNTTATVTTAAVPLHLPVFFLLTEKGPENIPVGGDGGTLPAVFGSGTFDNTKSFFNHSTMGCMRAMGTNQVFVVRVVDDAATTSNLVLQCTLTAGSIPQYQRDATGALILNAAGSPQAKTDPTTGAPISEPGYTATWSTRALATGETYDGLTKTVTGSADAPTSITFPIMGLYAKSRGSANDRQGFRFWASTSVDPAVESRVSSALYRFQPIELADDLSGNVSYIQDIYSQNYNDISLKASAIDPSTAQDVSLAGILSTNYPSSSTSALDYDIKVYSANITAIGALLTAVAPTEFPASLDPFTINLVSGLDMNGNTYNHFVVDESTEDLLNSSTVLYLQGGSDGDTSVSNFESLVTAYLENGANTEFQDQFRYPFNFFYDTGYALSNKYSLLNMLSLRDGIYLQMTTYDNSQALPNTAAQDQSLGAALLARLRTFPESTDFGTGTCRASIDAQAGHLAVTSGYTDGYVSPVLDVLSKNCLYYAGTFVNGSPKGRPNSEVTIFRDVSWSSANATQKQMNWDTGLNVISYADQTTMFYPDRRTVYADSTALLSSETFVHYIVFIKRIARTLWTMYVGREEPISQLKDEIAKDVDQAITKVFNSRITSTTTVEQTDADKVNGFSYTIIIALVGSMPDRIWNVEIPVTRDTDVTTSSSS